MGRPADPPLERPPAVRLPGASEHLDRDRQIERRHPLRRENRHGATVPGPTRLAGPGRSVVLGTQLEREIDAQAVGLVLLVEEIP
jgi:hypothetical protein